MDEIIQKANELGKMIHETDVYSEYKELSDRLDGEPQSKQLLEEYMILAESFHKREINGDTVENFEIERLAELKENIEENDLIIEYLGAKSSYIKLLELIQKSISTDAE